VQPLGQRPGQAGHDHFGRTVVADPLLRGDQRGQAGRVPPGQFGHIQDQEQARRGRDQVGDCAAELA
jgi:hypothetical protein